MSLYPRLFFCYLLQNAKARGNLFILCEMRKNNLSVISFYVASPLHFVMVQTTIVLPMHNTNKILVIIFSIMVILEKKLFLIFNIIIFC
jgi:hypothetical protein